MPTLQINKIINCNLEPNDAQFIALIAAIFIITVVEIMVVVKFA